MRLSDAEIVDVVRGVLCPGQEDGDLRVLQRNTFKRRHDWRGDRVFEKAIVHGAGMGQLPLLIKYAARARGTSRSVRDLAREECVYRRVLPGTALGTPKFIDSWAATDGSRRGLMIEFVPGRRLKNIEEEAVWEAAARWLAGMHRRFLVNGDSRVHWHEGLGRHDGNFLRRTAQRTVASLAAGPPGLRTLGETILSRYEKVAHVLTSAPRTLVHGEFYCTNILVARNRNAEGDLRVCPIDWETAAVGCGALDLAHLLRHGLSIDREVLIDAYLDQWNSGDVSLDRRTLEVQLTCARVHEVMYLAWQGVKCGSISRETIERRLVRVERHLRDI